MNIYRNWVRGFILVILSAVLHFSFAELAEKSHEENLHKEFTASKENSSNESLECVIDDEVLGCWVRVKNQEECASGTTAYQTEESNQILCLLVEDSSQTEEPLEENSSDESLECVIDDEVLGCWVSVENQEECTSGTTAYQTEESNQILCLLAE